MAKEWVRGGRNFDSHLVARHVGASHNAELILQIRVYLERIPPLSSIPARPPTMGVHRAGRSTPTDRRWEDDLIVPWSDQEWTAWRASVEPILQSAFNGRDNAGRYWLVPRDSDGRAAYWGVGEPSPTGSVQVPNVKCLFDIQLVPSAGNAQRVVQCVHYAPNARGVLRAYMDSEGGGMLHNLTTTGRQNITGNSQTAVVHEFFHALGMNHVNSPRNLDEAFVRFFTEGWQPNSEAEYGVTPRQRSNIMGGGSTFEGWNFWPWLNRLQAHLDADFEAPAVQWDVVDHWPSPQPVILNYDGNMNRNPGFRR